MDGRMDRRTDGEVDVRTDSQPGRRTDRWTGSHADTRMAGRTDGRTDRAARPPGGTAGSRSPGSARTAWGNAAARICAKIAAFEPRSTSLGRGPNGGRRGRVSQESPRGVRAVVHPRVGTGTGHMELQPWGSHDGPSMEVLAAPSISPLVALRPSHPLHGCIPVRFHHPPAAPSPAGIPQKGAQEPTAAGSALVSAPTRPTQSWEGGKAGGGGKKTLYP